MDDSEFQALRNAPLHRLTPEEWRDWYPRMASYISDAGLVVWEAAVGRLMMGVFRSDRERCGNDDREASDTDSSASRDLAPPRSGERPRAPP